MTSLADLGTLLTRLRAALHFDPERAPGTVSGVPATLTWQCHEDGRIRIEVASALPDAAAFDGLHGSHVGPSGVVESLDLGDLDELRMSSALFSGTWLSPRAPILFERAVEAGDTVVLQARMGPESWRQTFRIVCAARSLQPKRLETLSGDGAVFEVDGFAQGIFCAVPRFLRWRRGWLADTVEISSIQASAQTLTYVLPDARGNRVAHVDASVPSKVRTTRSPRGRLPLARGTIDGRDVGWLLLDSGAGSSAIDVIVADRLGLTGLGRSWIVTPTGGMGTGYRRASVLRVGPLTIPDPLLVELDLGPISTVLGVRVAGILGFDLFAQSMVRLVHEPLTIELFGSEHAPAAIWHDVRFQDRVPMLKGVLGGNSSRSKAGLIALDTASSAPVLLREQIAADLALAQRPARRAVSGVSGAGSLGVASLPWIEVGGEQFKRVRALISDASEGALASTTTLGSLGWGFFRGRELLLDWPRQRISMKPARAD